MLNSDNLLVGEIVKADNQTVILVTHFYFYDSIKHCKKMGFFGQLIML